MALPRAHLAAEDGVGLVSSLAGMFVFLAFLLFATQLLVHLFASSYVNAAAFDAARMASGSGNVSAETARAHGLEVLGGFSSRVEDFVVDRDADRVTVTVRAQSPALLPRMFGRIIGAERISRTVTLRREQPVCEGC